MGSKSYHGYALARRRAHKRNLPQRVLAALWWPLPRLYNLFAAALFALLGGIAWCAEVAWLSLRLCVAVSWKYLRALCRAIFRGIWVKPTEYLRDYWAAICDEWDGSASIFVNIFLTAVASFFMFLFLLDTWWAVTWLDLLFVWSSIIMSVIALAGLIISPFFAVSGHDEFSQQRSQSFLVCIMVCVALWLGCFGVIEEGLGMTIFFVAWGASGPLTLIFLFPELQKAAINCLEWVDEVLSSIEWDQNTQQNNAQISPSEKAVNDPNSTRIYFDPDAFGVGKDDDDLFDDLLRKLAKDLDLKDFPGDRP